MRFNIPFVIGPLRNRAEETKPFPEINKKVWTKAIRCIEKTMRRYENFKLTHPNYYDSNYNEVLK